LDNRLGGRLATEHLIQQGYQCIGIITGPGNWWEARERLEGWREALKAAGRSYNEKLVVEGDWNAPSGEAGLQALLDRNPEMDAVFVSNDQMSLGALQATRCLGLRVPDDLGLVGFDDIPEAAYFYPPLTTVRQDTRKLGAMAVERINTLIQARHEGGTSEASTSWLAPSLVVRKSSVRQA
jgi:LacI family transcriptional regulator